LQKAERHEVWQAVVFVLSLLQKLSHSVEQLASRLLLADWA
jgi:hypothetical protein